MFIQCAYRNARRNETVESYAVDKIRARVQKLVAKPIGIHVKFESAPTRQTTNCRILAGDGFSVNARHTSEDFFKAVDGMVDKLAKQLRRKKTIAKAHHRMEEDLHLPRATPALEPVDANEWDDWFYEARH